MGFIVAEAGASGGPASRARLRASGRAAVSVADRAQVAVLVDVAVRAQRQRPALRAIARGVALQRPSLGLRRLAVAGVAAPLFLRHEAIHCVSLDFAVRATDATTASMTSTVNGIETANTSW